MKKLLLRLIYGLMFAFPLMLLTFALAQASGQPQGEQPPQATQSLLSTPTALVCEACHQSFQDAWETSAHGHAATDPAFTKAWEDQGKPSECLTCHVTGYNPDTNTWSGTGITCEACHDTTAANHPLKPMAADRSAKLCGTCHQETYFEWQGSQHRQAGVDCIACHDPHSTQLKAKDTADQCDSCHRELASDFAHTAHSQANLTCADCHLAKLTDPTQEGHARLDHSFGVQLSTCNSCHQYQMHDPAQVHEENPTPTPLDALAAVEGPTVTASPTPVSPVGFATLSGLFGLAAGAILAPWLERWTKGKKDKEQDQ